MQYLDAYSLHNEVMNKEKPLHSVGDLITLICDLAMSSVLRRGFFLSFYS